MPLVTLKRDDLVKSFFLETVLNYGLNQDSDLDPHPEPDPKLF
jgi:hypothetical protein